MLLILASVGHMPSIRIKLLKNEQTKNYNMSYAFKMETSDFFMPPLDIIVAGSSKIKTL